MAREMFEKFWDFFVVYAIFTGWFFSKINPFNSSLLFAWMVCMCDSIYNIDVLARTSKQARPLSEVFKNVSLLSVLQLCATVPLILVSCVPYHALVVLELDISGVYLLLCMLRVGRLLLCGRFYFASLFSFLCEKVREGLNKPEKTLGQQNYMESNGSTMMCN